MVTCPRPPVFGRLNKLAVKKRNIFRRLTPIRQNLHGRRCRKLLRMQCNKNPFEESKDKMLATFERHRFDRVTRTRAIQTRLNNSTVKCTHFLAVLLCFAKIFRKKCVEKCQKFNGVDFFSTRARTKVLASFETCMNSPNLPWHVNITSLKHRTRPCFRQIIHGIMA